MAYIIIIGIVLLFAALLNFKVRAEIKFCGGKLDFKVKYLWLTLFPLKEKKKKPRRQSKQPEKKEISEKKQYSSAEEPYTVSKEDVEAARRSKAEEAEPVEDVKQKEELTEKIDKLTDLIEKVKIIWGVSYKWLGHIFKHIYIDGLVIDFVIAEGDAYDTAMRYGTVNAVVYNILNVLRLLFSVDIKTVDIVCDFDGKASVYDGEVKICLRPATALNAVFCILFGLLLNLRKLIPAKKEKTAAAVN